MTTLDYRDRLGYQNLPRHPLIICASLVSHPGNLGALCRTVEAFRLESLVMADAADSDNREFRGLAVSAYHWQPTTICPPNQLTQWLHRHLRIHPPAPYHLIPQFDSWQYSLQSLLQRHGCYHPPH